MVVIVDKVDAASLVDANVDELVSIAYRDIRFDVDLIVGEADSSIYADCYPDDVSAAVETGLFPGVGDAAERLVDQMIVRVNCQVADLVVVERVESMGGVERIGDLRESCSSIVATIDEDVVGCGVGMIGYANLVGSVSSDPFPVVHRDCCSSRV